MTKPTQTPEAQWDSPMHRLVEEHYEEFERVYPDRIQNRYGFWRPVIRTAVLDYLKCGDLREGVGVPCGHSRHFGRAVSLRSAVPRSVSGLPP